LGGESLKILVTRGAGFIGSKFVRYLLHARRDVELFNFDKLTYAGNIENLAEVAQDHRYHFVRGDIADQAAVDEIFQGGFSAIVHFAAETHVDRSIEDASPFLKTNILGTHCLLDAARRFHGMRFIHISTDEVYGSAQAGMSFTEGAAPDPRSPYAASKASAEHLVTAYANTYGVSAVILRRTNKFGPFQFPEKLIPLMVANALEHLDKPDTLIQYVEDRPGHDRRYALDSSKIRRELGWTRRVTFDEGIHRTIKWYQSNSGWLDHARSGEYSNYYDRHYFRT
jgi:dTDP-glucose 4,6-dehydratase